MTRRLVCEGPALAESPCGWEVESDDLDDSRVRRCERKAAWVPMLH
jgi:hypothetical protein